MNDDPKVLSAAFETASWCVIVKAVRTVAFGAGIVLLVQSDHPWAALGVGFLYLLTE